MIDGAPNTPVAPAAPAAPAPAPAAPANPPVSPQPHTLVTDFQQPAAPAAPVAPAVTPAPAPAPASPASPAPDAVAEQRIKDAQRKMHEATAEAARLRNELNGILNHPQLGPVIQKVTAPPTPGQTQDDELKAAFKAWQAAPSDEDAYRQLVAVAEARSKRAVMEELRNREAQRVNQARAQQRDLLVAQAINKEVTDKAPDVPLELFWAMSSKAELETPANLITVAEKLEWQIQRAVELARGVLAPRVQAAQQNTTQQQGIRQTAGVVMPPGGAAPGSGSTPSGQTVSFVDQLKAVQARKIPATT